MSLKRLRKNLNKASAVAAVIGIATCVFPALAQAQQVRRPPQIPSLQIILDPNQQANVSSIEFSLDTSVEDTNPSESVGEFPGAIQNLTIDSNNDNLDLFLPSGNLTTSRLTIAPNGDLLPIIKDNKIMQDNIKFSDISGNGGFNNGGLRYDVTFPGRTEKLTLFIPSNDPSLINSLSGFTDFSRSNQIQAVVSRPDVPPPENIAKVVASNPEASRQSLRVTVATVSEPNATASLLGVGALGAVALLKRNKREV